MRSRRGWPADEVEVVDLTTPLSEDTPVIALPQEFAPAWPFEREVISRYDEPGPVWFWHNIRLSEHTGTHFDAPVHWLSGKDLDDVSQVPPQRLVGPAAVIDCSQQAAADPDFVLDERARRGLAGRARAAARRRLAAVSHRLGREDRRRRSSTTATPPASRPRLRALARRADADPRHRRRDRRHRRGPRGGVRPAVSLPLVLPRREQVRPDPAAQPRPASAAGRRRRRVAAADHRRDGQPRPRARARRAPAEGDRGRAPGQPGRVPPAGSTPRTPIARRSSRCSAAPGSSSPASSRRATRSRPSCSRAGSPTPRAAASSRSARAPA